MLKDYYSIGETASLMGITAQTLRYYDKIGLLSPCYTNPENGYRYYRYQQFHILDRVKYLQGFGLSLEEIGTIIQSGKVDRLLECLRQRRLETEDELRELQNRLKGIDWCIDYFTYMDSEKAVGNLYKVQLPTRYIIKCPCYYHEPLPNMEIRLAEVKSRPEYANVKFDRQYGYSLDIESLFQWEFYPRSYFTYLSGKPRLEPTLYEELPAGEYLCFRAQLLHQNWDPTPLTTYFDNKEPPALALALEFEDNLVDWSDAWYEIQILL